MRVITLKDKNHHGQDEIPVFINGHKLIHPGRFYSSLLHFTVIYYHY